jgi:cell wall-associated NlpC family hydrolase
MHGRNVILRYGYVRAKTRAVATAAGAALVVVPLSGAAAVALVSQHGDGAVVGPNPVVVAEQSAVYSDSVATVSNVVIAGTTAEYDLPTPTIKVKDNPPPPASTPRAQPVAQSSSVKAAIAGSEIIAEASKYVGTPYKAGGTSPSGFDCSGFIYYVFKQFGITLPRTSSGYYSVGTRVSSPQPGDIIVTPGHVGIYAGPNLQIDAPTSGKTIQFRSIWQSNPIYVRVT